ncbi:MAG: hypothetical protein FWD95_06555 [Nocardioidaceae bacterium]|nr:hypothetical protein [Nocardioidaceae bacterium]
MTQSAPTVVVLVGLLVMCGVVLSKAQHLWFWRDDWAFLRPRVIDPWQALVLNYNGHWSALPWLWFRTTRSLVGLRHYAPYAVAPVLLQLLTFLLLYALLRRTEIGRWTGAAAVLVTAALAIGVGAENTLWLATIGFLGACAFGLLGVLLADLGGPWRWLAPVALLLGVMCSNVGLILLALAGGWGLRRLGLLRTAALVGPPAVLYVAWFLTYARIRPPVGTNGPWTNSPPIDWGHGSVRMAAGIADVWTAATGVHGAGPLVLVVLVLGVYAARRRPALGALGLGGLVALVLGFALFGFGKASAHTLPTQPRYEYVGVLVCGPAVACLAHVVARRVRDLRWAYGLVAAAAVLLAGATGVARVDVAADVLRPQTTDLHNRVVATAWLHQHGEQTLSDPVWSDPSINHGVTVPMLTDPTMLPLLPSGPPPDRALLVTRAQVQVGVGPTAFDLPDATCTPHGPSGGKEIAVRAGAGGAQVRLRLDPVDSASGPSVVRTRLVSATDGTPFHAWTVDAGEQTAYVATSAPDVTLLVRLPAGATADCGR